MYCVLGPKLISLEVVFRLHECFATYEVTVLTSASHISSLQLRWAGPLKMPSHGGPPPSTPDPATAKTTTDSDASNGAKINPGLTGVPATLLVTLACRAADCASTDPILNDVWATAALSRLEYADPSGTVVVPATDQASSQQQSPRFVVAVLVRAKLFDSWTSDFLSRYAPSTAGSGDDGAAGRRRVTVLHLGCGLDSRALRVAASERGKAARGVRWIDVDMPEVIALRNKVIPDVPDVPEWEYRAVGSSVTEDGWLDDIAASIVPQEKVLVVMEGLLMYLEPDDARGLVTRVCERFSSGSSAGASGGELVFDIFGSLFLRLQKYNKPVAATGAVMRFGLDNERDLLALHKSLKVAEVQRYWQIRSQEPGPWLRRLLIWIFSRIPVFKTLSSYLRYEF